MTLDQLISRLQAMKGSGGWRRLAKQSGVDYFTVARIARREIANPGMRTCERLMAALPPEVAPSDPQAGGEVEEGV
ncbi:hypothetical protein [Eleftheria terrae]|uniref:hypothetical protein n=1 Tax=Eleftheria terrae TaxID=1597781 RepID=UPI00263B0D16|nr:hypothetical protein [Eleftheria terrae]WKB52996.1 hypothetical protein N7L95_00915 [Eleftheria terrae]